MLRKWFVVLTIILSFVLSVAGAEDNGKRKLPFPHPARFWKRLEEDSLVQCQLCPRRCVLKPGQRGICGVRENEDGELVTYGYGNPVAVHIDPIEKKPFFHVWPGARAFSVAIAGCNMRCLFCQNWQISQARPDEVFGFIILPEELVRLVKEYKTRWLVYTYTEPTIFYEYMYDSAVLAKKERLFTGMHTCGYINPEPLKKLLPYIDAVNVDLKGFTEEFYNQMGLMASLQPVLETLKIVKESGTWLEITNLVIPGFNDDPKKVEEMCRWIVDNLGPDVPLHFSRFYPQHKLTSAPPTPIRTLERCVEIAHRCGLRFVYIGNVPGHKWESTYCPKCGALLIKRIGYTIVFNKIEHGRCPFCGEEIPGLWQDEE